MKKRIFLSLLVFLSVFIIGCGNDKTVSEDINSTTQNTNISDLNIIDYLKEPNEINLKGKIDNMDIHISLNKSDVEIPQYSDNPNNYSSNVFVTDHTRYKDEGILIDSTYKGTYYYDKIEKNINIIGILYKGGLFQIIEYSESNYINGYFKGYVNSNYISGVWGSAKTPEKYPFTMKEVSFYLISEDRELGKLQQSTEIQGYYKNKQNNEIDSSNIVIFNKTDNEFQFAIDSHHMTNTGVNIGSVGGTAVYTDASKMKAKYSNLSDDLLITFDFNNKEITINANDVIKNYGGINVNLTGTFIKEEPFK